MARYELVAVACRQPGAASEGRRDVAQAPSPWDRGAARHRASGCRLVRGCLGLRKIRAWIRRVNEGGAERTRGLGRRMGPAHAAFGEVAAGGSRLCHPAAHLEGQLLLASHWPDGPGSIPRTSVVTVWKAKRH